MQKKVKEDPLEKKKENAVIRRSIEVVGAHICSIRKE
jgi:hypothetical protein